MMKMTLMPWLLGAIFLNTAAQLLLKAGSNRLSGVDFSLVNWFSLAFQLLTNLPILFGLFCYVISVGIWIGVLSRTQVSVAYPMVSLGYVVNAIAAYYLFDEAMTFARIGGIFFILLGVYLVARS